MTDNGATPAGPPAAPVSQMLLHAENVGVRVHADHGFEFGVLDLQFAFAGSVCTIRVPAAAWPTIRESVDRALADAGETQPSASSGLVLPGNMNIDEAARAKTEADRRLRGGPTT